MLWRLKILLIFMSNIVMYTNEQQNPTTEKIHPYFTIPYLSKSFKDVFKGSTGGRPQLGTTRATCWARGGVCVDIRECPVMRFDVSVPGCSRGFKICCKSFQVLSPTTGLHRRENAIEVFSSDLKELEDDSVKTLAEKNNNLISFIRRSQGNELY